MASSVDSVVDAVEILENILYFLPLHDLLRLESVCPHFHSVIRGSLALQRKLFFIPTNRSQGRRWYLELDDDDYFDGNILHATIRQQSGSRPLPSGPFKAFFEEIKILTVNPLLLKTVAPEDFAQRWPEGIVQMQSLSTPTVKFEAYDNIREDVGAVAALRFKLSNFVDPAINVSNFFVRPHDHLRNPALPHNASCHAMYLTSPPVRSVLIEKRSWIKLAPGRPGEVEYLPMSTDCIAVSNTGGLKWEDVHEHVLPTNFHDSRMVCSIRFHIDEGFAVSQDELAKIALGH